jgi:HEAT repeat protein/S1-C subfamily serine protease
MFEYTCPRCRSVNRVKSAPSGKVVPCAECQHPLRVVVDSRGKGMASPLIAVGGAVGGLTVAALLLLVWFFAGRSPASTQRAAAPEEIKEWRTDTTKVVKTVTPVERPGQGKPDEGAGLSETELYNRMLKSVCWIIGTARQRGKDMMWTGSGSLVDRDERLVLTNEHVAPDYAETLTVLFPIIKGGKPVSSANVYLAAYKAKQGIKATLARAPDRKRDLSLIQLERLPEGVVPVRLAGRQARPGQKVHTVGGKPRGNQGLWIYSPGSVRQVTFEQWQYADGFPRSADVIASTVPLNPGDSGGALVDDRAQLVGVNNGGMEGNANYRHINLNEVIDFITLYFRSVGKSWTPPVNDDPTPGAEEKVTKLLADLAGMDRTARKKAIKELGLLGSDARKAIPDLLKVLRNRSEPDDLRDPALESLATIGQPSREQVPAVIDALRDKDVVEARRYAADVLGPVCAKAPDAVDALIMALKDRDEKVRSNAARSLGTAGPVAAAKARPELVTLLRDADRNVRKAALKALPQFGKPEVIEIAREKAILADRSAPTEARIYACAILSFAGEDVAPAISESLTADTDRELALEVVEALRELKAKKKEVGLALSRVLDHKDPIVRREAARALRDIGFDPALIAAFLKALASPDVEVRLMAATKLPSLSTFQKESPALNLTKDSLDSIKTALVSTETLARGVAAYALGSLGEEGAGGIAALRAAVIKETDSRVKLEMLAAFAQVGPAAVRELADKADELLDTLLDMASEVREANRPLQNCAAISLYKLAPSSKQGEKALPIVVRALLVRNMLLPAGLPAARFMKTAQPGSVEAVVKMIELELHERAKEILVKGGRPAAEAIAKTFNTTFVGTRADAVQTTYDKAYARKAAFEILARLGPDANLSQVQTIFIRHGNLWKKGQEFPVRGVGPDVMGALREARDAVNTKPKK